MGIKEFKEKLMSDDAFAAKFANVKSAEELVELAAKDGYTFTVEDMKINTELTDAEVASAAGGTTIFAKSYFVPGTVQVTTKTYFVSN